MQALRLALQFQLSKLSEIIAHTKQVSWPDTKSQTHAQLHVCIQTNKHIFVHMCGQQSRVAIDALQKTHNSSSWMESMQHFDASWICQPDLDNKKGVHGRSVAHTVFDAVVNRKPPMCWSTVSMWVEKEAFSPMSSAIPNSFSTYVAKPALLPSESSTTL